MVVAQQVKEDEITEQTSLLLTRNLLRIAIFNIIYIRGLFPEKYFSDKSVPALEMKIKKLMPIDAESRRLIDWMEKGVYDALQKKYLKTLLFCVCEAVDGPMIEEYEFSFSYSDSVGEEVSMNINRTGNKKPGGTFKCNSIQKITPQQMRNSACKLVRTLVQLMKTLDKMPDERTILMKLLYYDDVTPSDYEPPLFKSCSEEEAHHPWTKSPLKIKVGDVNSKYFVWALKVKSVLDPCEDENQGAQEDDVSLGVDSMQRDEYSDSDSEVDQTQEGEYIVAPIRNQKEQPREDNAIPDEDNTQDSVQDEHQLTRVMDWIIGHHLDTIELTDVLSNFPGISEVLTEDIMNKLVDEGVISKLGRDTYTIIKKKSDYEFTIVKEEHDASLIPSGERTLTVEDRMYMKALYYVLPLKYVTVAKLQNMLEGEANQNAVRKIIDKMAVGGFVEAKGNGRLGKRVIRSEFTQRKLNEVRKTLKIDAMDVDSTEPNNKSHHTDFKANGNTYKESSTCGALHSVGSDLTRMKVTSDKLQNDSTSSGQNILKAPELGNTLTSRTQSVASRESFALGSENKRSNGNGNQCDEVDTVICCRSSQDKRARKASTIKEPIIQYVKRPKI